MIRVKAEPKAKRKKRTPPPVEQAESLKSYFDRANNVLDELATHKLDLSQVYKDAKDAGYDPKILRKIVTEKRRDQTDLAEEQALIEAYKHALSEPVKKAIAMVASGSTLDEASKATGAPRSTVARLTPRAPVSKPRVLETAPSIPPSEQEGEGVPSGRAEPSDEHSTTAAREQGDDDQGLGAAEAGDAAHSGDAGRQEPAEHAALAGRPSGDSEGVAGAGSAAEAAASSTTRHVARNTPPGPDDPIWDELATIKRDIDEAFRRSPAQGHAR